MINAFVRTHRKGTLFGNVVYNKYLKSARSFRSPLKPSERARLDELASLFQKYSEQYEFDWLLIAAQAYQESRLKQNLRSRAGAIGIMQVLPTTAQQIKISNIDQLENNVHAGVKYLRWIANHYFDDEALDPMQRHLFALAAYNAGPTRIARMRRNAIDKGFDPDLWFDNVEVLAARKIGRETVQYVGNIVKYYVAYRMITHQIETGTTLETD